MKLLTKAYETNQWGAVYLGRAYFNGWGVPKDYGKAKKFLEEATWGLDEVNYLLGLMYTQGLGVSQDIKKGVEYLQKAGSNEEAKKELLKYKKTLFGKWVRR